MPAKSKDKKAPIKGRAKTGRAAAATKTTSSRKVATPPRSVKVDHRTELRAEPYFPHRVEQVRKLRKAGKTFSEISREVGISRAGCHYLYRRWIADTMTA